MEKLSVLVCFFFAFSLYLSLTMSWNDKLNIRTHTFWNSIIIYFFCILEKAFDAFNWIANARATSHLECQTPTKPVCSLMSSLNCILRAKMWNSFGPDSVHTGFSVHCAAHQLQTDVRMRAHFAFIIILSLSISGTHIHTQTHSHKKIPSDRDFVPGPCKNVYYSLIWYLFTVLRAVTEAIWMLHRILIFPIKLRGLKSEHFFITFALWFSKYGKEKAKVPSFWM